MADRGAGGGHAIESVRSSGPVSATPETPRLQRSKVRRILHYALPVVVVALLTIEAVLIAPHLQGARTALDGLQWHLVLLAIGAEAVSMLAFAFQYRRLLRGGGLRVPVRSAAAVVLSANALSSTLPAGSALASGYAFQRLRRLGATPPLAGWTVVMSGLVSGAAIATIGIVAALAVGIDTSGMPAAIAGVSLAVSVGLVVGVAARHPASVAALGRRVVRLVNRLLRRDPDAGTHRVHSFAEQVTAIRPSPAIWIGAVALAIVNWSADVACLVFAIHAVGIEDLPAQTLLITYAADAAVGTLQLMPGGIGTIDGALILALVNGGIPAGSAAAAVLIYRAITFGLAAIVGWIVWFVLHRRARQDRTAASERVSTPQGCPDASE